jgi:hypothetical protein
MATVFQPAPPPSNGASALVTAGFSSAQQYAAAAFNESIGFLAQLSGAAAQLDKIPLVDSTLPPVANLVTPFTMPALPVVPAGLGMNLPAVPVTPTLKPVGDITVGAAPVFTAQIAAIDLNIPVPVPLSATVPTAPTLPAIVVPTAPPVVLPAVPNLIGINVPTAPLLNLPTFNAVQPGSPLAPNFIFAFAEPAYTSGLLQDLRSQLDIWVNGASTGLSAAVEQAIWDRGRSREVTASARKMGESIRMFAARGFTKPPGALNLDIQQSLQDSQSLLAGQSRDVMIKQADLEQTNRRFAFETAWKVEEGLITYNSQIAQRAFEAAKYAQQVGIDIFHEAVARYVADIQAYSVNVEVFKAAIQEQLALLDIYKAELDGQRLISEINVQAVDVYKAEIDGVRAVIDVFRAQVDAANVSATINKTQIESFASLVGAYAETVRAKASEYDAYATQVKAEVSKADVFSAEASAYSSIVNGFKSGVDALVAQKDIEIRVGQTVPLDLFKTLTDAYRVQVGAETDRVDALVKTYQANTQVFTAEVQGQTSLVNSEVEVIKADTELAVATGNLRIEAAKANIANLMQEINYLIESVKGGAQVAAQLAAAALSSVNLSGQIGDHTTYGVGFNVSESTSTSDSNNTSISQVTSTAKNTSDITSAATNTNANTSDSTSTSVATNTQYNFTP